jgi:4,5:9,10-diseco-3-hydroxy-5,9,17-trioxoandrosta-1(10),2-diene-4-oate hydrolase
MTTKIQSKKIKVDGRVIHYYTAGQGAPLVVIHGGGGDARSWLKNVAVLAEKYTVYAPDLPGFGGSQPLDGSYYIPELTDFVESFAGSLGLEKFHLVGHSVGGGVALNYALKFPQKIKKLVLISSLCLGREIALWVRIMTLPARYADKALLALTKGIIWSLKTILNPLKVVVPLSLASVNFGSSIANFKEQTLVLAERLSDVLIPTLVVWGGRDPIVPVRHAYAAAEVIPDCQLKVFENRGHNVHRDELHQFSNLLTGFLG